jgi:hypothetical protein
MVSPSHSRSLLAALLAVLLGTPALAAACAPVRAQRPHCPLMAAGVCPASPETGHCGPGGEIEHRTMDCCTGPLLPTATLAAAASAPTLLPAGAILPDAPLASPRAVLHRTPAGIARSSPTGLYTLFRSLLI